MMRLVRASPIMGAAHCDRCGEAERNEQQRGVRDGSGDGKERDAMTDAPGSDDRTVTEYEVQDVEKANATGKQPVVFVHGL